MLKAVLFLFVTFSLSAQVKGVVVDENNKPIPYVSVWADSEDLGATAEENGEFSIDIKSDSNLIFSAIGFEKKVVVAALSKKVVLKQIAIRLDEIIIEKRKEKIEREIENKNNQKGTFLTGKAGSLLAKFFRYDTSYAKTKFLKQIVVETKSTVKDASFKLHLFSKGKNDEPDLELLDEDVIVSVKEGKRENKIDISKFNLTFPTDGFYVAVEVLLIEKNRYEDEHTKAGSSKKYSEVYFAPGLVTKLTDEATVFRWYQGKWFRTKRILDLDKKNGASFLNGKVIEPAINLILTN